MYDWLQTQCQSTFNTVIINFFGIKDSFENMIKKIQYLYLRKLILHITLSFRKLMMALWGTCVEFVASSKVLFLLLAFLL
jgi:hypothetical protein